VPVADLGDRWRELRRQRLLRHADDPIMCARRLPGGRSSAQDRLAT